MRRVLGVKRQNPDVLQMVRCQRNPANKRKSGGSGGGGDVAWRDGGILGEGCLLHKDVRESRDISIKMEGGLRAESKGGEGYLRCRAR